jgi:hypothetical protein
MYWKKSTKGKPKHKFHAAFGHSLELERVMVLKNQVETLYLFSILQGRQKIQKAFEQVQKVPYGFNFKGLGMLQ